MTTPSTLTVNSPRAQRHIPLLQSIMDSGVVAVTLHDASSPDLTYLDLFCDNPDRLNRPKHEVIGQPVTCVDDRISGPRKRALERAIANGSSDRYHYNYDDQDLGLLFKFDVTVAPLYGTEEIITIVTDSEAWQRDWWANRLATRKREQ